MPKDRFTRLEEIGFVWNALDKKFKRGCLATFRYKEQFGSPNAPPNYITPEGFKLGEWQDIQRKCFKEGTVNKEWITRLEDVGFAWGIYDKTFENGFQETLRYKERFGTSNAPDDYYDGFDLGYWQNCQRKYFWKGD